MVIVAAMRTQRGRLWTAATLAAAILTSACNGLPASGAAAGAVAAAQQFPTSTVGETRQAPPGLSPSATVAREGNKCDALLLPVMSGVEPMPWSMLLAGRADTPLAGPDFLAMFDYAAHPNTARMPEPPPIVADPEFDDAVRSIAAARGYGRRAPPEDVALLVAADRGRLLQPEAAEAWVALRDAAEADGVELVLDSAHRGYDYQGAVFLRPMRIPFDLDEFAERMRMSAPPGYSKHHTGYAIDVSQPGWDDFGTSPAFRWLSRNRYANALEHGWVPSYPPDGGRQGPVPEPWEYVWVGTGIIDCWQNAGAVTPSA